MRASLRLLCRGHLQPVANGAAGTGIDGLEQSQRTDENVMSGQKTNDGQSRSLASIWCNHKMGASLLSSQEEWLLLFSLDANFITLNKKKTASHRIGII
jgi:hypothetical protein